MSNNNNNNNNSGLAPHEMIELRELMDTNIIGAKKNTSQHGYGR